MDLAKTKRFFFSGVTAEEDTRGVTVVGVLNVTEVDVALGVATVVDEAAGDLPRGLPRLDVMIFYINKLKDIRDGNKFQSDVFQLYIF